MLSGTDKMFGKIAASKIPVCAQLAKRVCIAHFGQIRLGLNNEICMSEFVCPFVPRV